MDIDGAKSHRPGNYAGCCDYTCWTRIKHYCICVRTQYTGDQLSVLFCESDLRLIFDQAGGGGVSWRVFQDVVQAEADKAARSAAPILATANDALSALGSDQSLLSLRFCIKVGPIRICVEWLL